MAEYRSSSMNFYTGVWTNWSHGKVLGSTLTLSKSNGNLLIAFVALFVAFTGTCAFRLACFIFHRSFSSKHPQDAVYHQRQAILRNSANGITAFWEFCRLSWSWKRSKQRGDRYLIPLTIYILMSVCAFAVAGVFSSNIAAMTGNEILLKFHPTCGRWSAKENITIEALTGQFIPLRAQQEMSSFNYARNCYLGSATGSDDNCGSFIKPHLTRSVTYNASCPFKETICRTKDQNMIYDTGMIDSHTHLGINAPEHERVQLRRVVHCSPLVTEGYSENVNFSGSVYTNYNYGPNYLGELLVNNSTHTHITRSELERLPNDRPASMFPLREYSIDAYYNQRVNGSFDVNNSIFRPIDELVREDADVIVIFLSSNYIVSLQEVEDFWFSAHSAYTQISFPNGYENKMMMANFADDASSPLACAQQYQICLSGISTTSNCTPLSSYLDTRYALSKLSGVSKTQIDRSSWIYRLSATFGLLPDSLSSMGSSGLIARTTLFQGLQLSELRNQWQTEIDNFLNVTLAKLQMSFVTLAIGLNEDLQTAIAVEKNTFSDQLCATQKVRSNAYVNFSVFGLSFIFLVGGVIVIVSYSLEGFIFQTGCGHWRKQKTKYKPSHHRLEWITNGTLQLQRLAHEELGLGTWTKCDDSIPITSEPTQLAILDIHDTKHPRLCKFEPESGRNSPSKSSRMTVHSSAIDQVDMDSVRTQLPIATGNGVVNLDDIESPTKSKESIDFMEFSIHRSVNMPTQHRPLEQPSDSFRARPSDSPGML